MKNIAKYTTLAILVVAFVIGCLGPWFKVFNMEGYTSFLLSFSPFYLGLIASIGINSGIEKTKGGKVE